MKRVVVPHPNPPRDVIDEALEACGNDYDCLLKHLRQLAHPHVSTPPDHAPTTPSPSPAPPSPSTMVAAVPIPTIDRGPTGDGQFEAMNSLIEGGESLAAAAAEVSRTSGISACAAIKAYERRPKTDKKKTNTRCVLTKDQEVALVSVCQAFTASKNSLKAWHVQLIIYKLWEHRVSGAWVSRFIARHKRVLATRHCQALSKKRVAPVMVDAVDGFVRVIAAEHARAPGGHLPAFVILNVDEYRVIFKEKAFYFTKRLSGDGKADVVSSRRDAGVSYLPFVAADGTRILDVIVGKARFDDEHDEAKARTLVVEVPRRYKHRGEPRRIYVFSPTSYVDGIAWDVIVREFKKEWVLHNPGLDCYVYCDHLDVHSKDTELLKECVAEVRVGVGVGGGRCFFVWVQQS